MALGLFLILSQSHLTYAVSPKELQVPSFVTSLRRAQSLAVPTYSPSPFPTGPERQTLTLRWSGFPPPLNVPLPIYLRFCAAEVLALLALPTANVTNQPVCRVSGQRLPHTMS